MQDLMQRLNMTGKTSESTSKPLTLEERIERQRQDVEWLCERENAREGTLHLTDGYECDLCKNKGWTREAVKSEISGFYCETMIPCKCQKVRATIKRLERSGLKNIIRDYTFAKFDPREPWQRTIKDAAMKFVKDADHNWFFIGGQSGSGKTHICTAIAGYYLRSGKAAKYMLWMDDVSKLNSCVNDAEAFAAMMDELKTVEILYIDDLFKTGKGQDGNPAQPTPAEVKRAFEIINYRYNNPGLVTIISSERSIQAITNIDEAIGGRIAEKAFHNGYGFNIKRDPSKNQRMRGCVDL